MGTKFSQVALAGVPPISTTVFIGYDSAGPTDLAWTLAQTAAGIMGSTATKSVAGVYGPTVNNTNAGTTSASGFTFQNDAGNVASFFYTSANYSSGFFSGNTFGFFVEGTFVVNSYDLAVPTSRLSLSISPQATVQISGGFTVALLPTGQPAGSRAFVTDASTTTYSVGAAVTGGGTAKIPVFYNGSAWVAG